MTRTYSELITLPTFEERFEYCKLNGNVGSQTFGGHRYLNQLLYKDPEWKRTRGRVILRDTINGHTYDLAFQDPDHEILGRLIFVHHLNPITIEDVLNRDPKVFDLENLITTIKVTHDAIHYGNKDSLPKGFVERRPGDTCPWKVY